MRRGVLDPGELLLVRRNARAGLSVAVMRGRAPRQSAIITLILEVIYWG